MGALEGNVAIIPNYSRRGRKEGGMGEGKEGRTDRGGNERREKEGRRTDRFTKPLGETRSIQDFTSPYCKHTL